MANPLVRAREDIATLFQLLDDFWGFKSFRPSQPEIILSVLGGHDVAAVMPTAAGKSLCYQLPAVAIGGTTVVISPLIALMEDQVGQLHESGVPAAALHSNMSKNEQQRAIGRACRGDVRLLYMSPERLARRTTRKWFRELPLSFFAVDEAHCISEWGHDFRPEYRQLGLLREYFPSVPIAAFTASATQLVRHDILRQLHLRQPHTYVRSFFRPNLRFWNRQCDRRTQHHLLLGAVHSYDGDIIVYCPTIACVEDTCELVARSGVKALTYHGKMEPQERNSNQAAWMNGEASVMICTSAFGMGINRSSVRAVIHMSLPKSIEQYYQEAGRAGRDGAPADCILFWRCEDADLIAHFINESGSASTRRLQWDRFRAVQSFAQGNRCRHETICTYFGQNWKHSACGACDICGFTPNWLTDARQRDNTVDRSLALDVDLMAFLREWRRGAAIKAGLPAYVVLPDSTLEDIATRQPRSLTEVRAVSGIGERKAATYGPLIIEAIATFHGGARASGKAKPNAVWAGG